MCPQWHAVYLARGIVCLLAYTKTHVGARNSTQVTSILIHQNAPKRPPSSTSPSSSSSGIVSLSVKENGKSFSCQSSDAKFAPDATLRRDEYVVIFGRHADGFSSHCQHVTFLFDLCSSIMNKSSLLHAVVFIWFYCRIVNNLQFWVHSNQLCEFLVCYCLNWKYKKWFYWIRIIYFSSNFFLNLLA